MTQYYFIEMIKMQSSLVSAQSASKRPATQINPEKLGGMVRG